MRFWQQHVIITGGSSGIGKAVARLLVKQGANVSIIARTPARLEATKTELEAIRIAETQRVIAVPADVAERSQIIPAVETAVDQIGPPQVLITCAGMSHPGHFIDLPVEIFEQTMAVNYFGTLYSIKAVYPWMVKQRQGHIVLVSSGAGLIGLFSYTAYSPTKFAVRALAESLRGELKPHGIKVSIVYPPDVDTPQLHQENKTKPNETKLMTGPAGVLSAEQVADALVEGLKQKRWLIAPGLEMKLLARWHSLLMPGLNWYFDRLVARVQRSTGNLLQEEE